MDFPADSFFNVFVEVDLYGGLYNKTPMILEAKRIDQFPPNLNLPESTYIHDPSFGAVPLFFANGLPFGHLQSAGHGSSTTASLGLGQDAQLVLTFPVAFTVDAMSNGLDPATTMKSPNHAFDDRPLSQQQVTVYLSSGVTPGAMPDISNLRIASLVGSVGSPAPPRFMAGDTINSFSIGRDGTVEPGHGSPGPAAAGLRGGGSLVVVALWALGILFLDGALLARTVWESLPDSSRPPFNSAYRVLTMLGGHTMFAGLMLLGAIVAFLMRRRPATPPQREPGRNDPCPCGSTLKFKRCCGA